MSGMKTVTFTEKTDEFGIAIATIYGLFVFLKYMKNAVLIDIAFVTIYKQYCALLCDKKSVCRI